MAILKMAKDANILENNMVQTQASSAGTLSAIIFIIPGMLTLFASGLIVGESLIGVALAAIIVVSVTSGGSDSPLALVGSDFADTAEFLGLIVFLITLAIFGKTVLGNKNN